MKRRFGGFAVFALLALTVFSIQGAAAATAAGSATASSYLFRLAAGDKTVSLGTDVAEAVRGDTTSALARLVAARAGDKTFGAGERTATRRTDSGKTAIAESKAQTVSGLLELGGFEGAVETKITSVNVSSLVSLSLGESDLLAGLVTVGEGTSASEAFVNDARATSTRKITFDGIEVFALGDFLAALGASPLDLACGAVEDVGARLGVDASQACEQLDTVNGLIDDAVSALQGAAGTLQSTADSLQATIDGAQASLAGLQSTLSGLEATKASLESQIASLCGGLIPNPICPTLQSQLASTDADIASVNAQIDSVQAQIDAATAQLADVLAGIDLVNDPVGSTCDAVSGVIGTVSGAVPGLAGTLDPIGTQLGAACDALAALLRGLLDTPLLSIGDVDVSISTVAREGDPEAVVKGTVGSVKVGALDPVVLDLSVVSDTVGQVKDLVGDTLAEITGAIGLQVPVPDFDLLVTETDKGERPDGTWFARGSVTALRLHFPAATLTLPDVAPLGVLGDAAGGLLDSVGAAAVQVSPELTVDLAVFEAASEFSPTGAAGTGEDEGLPATGAAPMLAAGAVALAGAGLLKRYLRKS